VADVDPQDITDLIDEAQTPPGMISIQGVALAPDTAGLRRLYLTLDMNEFVDIPTGNSEIVKTITTAESTPEYPLGSTTVWVRADAQLQYTRYRLQMTQEPVPADFLRGQVRRQPRNDADDIDVEDIRAFLRRISQLGPSTVARSC
jgi:hypothetical protein